MGNCFGKPKKPKKCQWAWKRSDGQTGGESGGKVEDGAGTGSANVNVITPEQCEVISLGVTVGRTGHVAAAEGTPANDIIPEGKATSDVMSVVSVASSIDVSEEGMAEDSSIIATGSALTSPDMSSHADTATRASSKADQNDDNYDSIFKLDLSKLDVCDQAAGLDANANNMPRSIDEFDLGKKLGDGAFGTVWEATDKRSSTSVAIKEVNGAFLTALTAKRAYREMFFMWQFGSHENILGLLGVYETPSSNVWLACEKMETDLCTVIRRGILDDDARRFITYQICSAAMFLHSANVIHRDFKSENVLWNRDHLVKICDFGMARSLSDVGKDDMTDVPMTAGMGTLWHAAPEIITGSSSYTTAIDVWSIGSLLVELFTGKLLAEEADMYQQFSMICLRLPVPMLDDITSLKSPFTALAVKIALGTVGMDRNEYGLDRFMTGVPADAIDLCRRMLWINPSKRCTIAEALGHGYLSIHRNPEKEIVRSDELVPPLLEWKLFDVDVYRKGASEIMNDIQEERRKH